MFFVGFMKCGCKQWYFDFFVLSRLKETNAANVVIGRARSFPQKILPNSAGQFAKFRSLLWQNRPNSTAHRGLLFGSKLN